MRNQNEHNEVDGYFVLSKNVDASELELEEHLFQNVNASTGKPMIYPGTNNNIDVGFRGVLDGQGYTIDGLTVKTCGLFANINAAVIKNIAFTNANLTGYYKTLFAKNYSRGKNYENGFNNYEGMFQNVYISINSIDNTSGDNNVGILTQGTLPGTVLIENVVIEYSNVSQDVQAQVEAGKSFYMFGATTLTMASSTSRFKDCYSISTAPVLQYKNMPGFAENQVEYTLTNNKVTAVGNVLDEQVTEVLTRCGKTLTIDHVLVGLKAYADYEKMAAANNDYSSFDAAYWTIANGVPVWNTAM